MALYGEKLSFKVSLRVGGRVPNYNATSGPQLTAEAEFESVELVSWGQVWQYHVTLSSLGMQRWQQFVCIRSQFINHWK